jgi:hypothetical protein
MYGMIGSTAAPITAIVFHKCCIFWMVTARRRNLRYLRMAGLMPGTACPSPLCEPKLGVARNNFRLCSAATAAVSENHKTIWIMSGIYQQYRCPTAGAGQRSSATHHRGGA